MMRVPRWLKRLGIAAGVGTILMAIALIIGGFWIINMPGSSYNGPRAALSDIEAIRAIARHNESLFRRIIDFSRARYDTDRATYHVSATLDSTPGASDVRDVRELERIYLEPWSDVPAGKGFTSPARQILHTTFGSVLNDATIRPEFFSTLRSHPETYKEILADHFARHLRELQRA